MLALAQPATLPAAKRSPCRAAAAPGPLAFAEIWDTVVQDGLLYLSNIAGGLFVVGFGCNDVPDPMLTSTG